MKFLKMILGKRRWFVLGVLIVFSFPVFAQMDTIQTEYSELRLELKEMQAELAGLKEGLLLKQVEQKPEVVQPEKKAKPVTINPTYSMEEFKAIHQELDAIAEGLVGLRGINNKAERKVVKEEPIDLFLPRVDIGSSPIAQERNRGLGFYVLPFLGGFQPDGLEWRSVGGDFEIEEEHGFSSGVRLGYGWKYFFSDFQVSYFHNEMESMDIGLPGLSFSGKTEGMGGHISAGIKIPVSQAFNLTLGGGLGGTYEDISLRLMGITVDEEDFLFSYQFFTGLEYHPTDYLRLGLRYRWLRVGEMELFTARDLHLAELALGYVF